MWTVQLPIAEIEKRLRGNASERRLGTGECTWGRSVDKAEVTRERANE
jgi:hypothetical protein